MSNLIYEGIFKAVLFGLTLSIAVAVFSIAKQVAKKEFIGVPTWEFILRLIYYLGGIALASFLLAGLIDNGHNQILAVATYLFLIMSGAWVYGLRASN
ncbi:MAG: hypothetical protein WC694_01205 [Candidatus Paceibacterota bacterium]|jgi:hypothetical protein